MQSPTAELGRSSWNHEAGSGTNSANGAVMKSEQETICGQRVLDADGNETT
jgi:hypothetical protein